MKLLDSNIIIYSYQPAFEYLKPLVIDPANSVSVVSRLEILGFHSIQNDEENYCNFVFQILRQLPVDDDILDKAIELRRQNRMKLADSIIAATALLYDAELVTRNVADYKGIPQLVVTNPIP